MGTTIGIDFEKLDSCIEELKTLLPQLEEPPYKKLDFWLTGKKGSGMVTDYMYTFGNRTIDFHEGTYKLIENTIAYLQEVKKLQKADQDIADSL